MIWSGLVETLLDLFDQLVVELAEGRHFNNEGGALLNLALNGNLTAHLLYKLFTNAYSEAEAVLVNAFMLLEALKVNEERLEAVLADAGASIYNLHFIFDVVEVVYGLRNVGVQQVARFKVG